MTHSAPLGTTHRLRSSFRAAITLISIASPGALHAHRTSTTRPSP
jgi:hypothetical protein